MPFVSPAQPFVSRESSFLSIRKKLLSCDSRLLSTFGGGEYSSMTLNFWRGSTSPTSARSHDRRPSTSTPWTPHLLEVGSTSPTSTLSTSAPPANPHLLEVGSIPLTSTTPTSAPWTSTPPSGPLTFWMWGVLPRRVLPGRVLPPVDPSPFGCGECSPGECSLDEYSPQRTLTFWRWGVLPQRVLPRRVLPSEPPAFVTNCDYLTLACVGRRGLATASGVSRAEVERT